MLRGDELRLESVRLKMLMYEMTIDLNVLHAFVKDRVASNVKSSSVKELERCRDP